MIKKTIPLLSLLLFMMAFGQAQTLLWNQQASSSTGRAIIPAVDNGYVIAGNRNYYTGVNKVDSSGNIDWFYSRSDGAYRDVISTRDNCYILFGQNWWEGDITKLDSLGNVKWNFTLEDNFYSGMELANGDIVALGSISSYGQPLLVRLDSGGNLLDSAQFLGDMFYSNPLDLKRLPNGGYSVVGTQGPVGYRSFIATFDSSFNRTQFRIHPDYDFSRHIVLPDGGFLVTGHTGDNVLAHKIVLQMDSTGSILWEKRMGTGSMYVTLAIGPNHEGGYLLAGRDKHTQFLTRLWIMQLDANGDSVRSWTWQDSIYHNAQDFIYEGNGEIVLATMSDYGHFVSKLYLPGLSIGVSPPEIPEELLMVYPQPSNGPVNFRWQESKVRSIQIYDGGGKLVWKGSSSGMQFSVDLAGFRRGIYFYEINSEDSRNTGKLIRH